MTTRIAVLAFRTGEAADAALNECEFQFYENVGALITGDRTCAITKKEIVRTIPIPQANIKDEQVLYDMAARGIAEFVGDATILIIDLANPPRRDLPISTLINALHVALQELWRRSSGGPAHAFILLSGAISDADFAYKAMRPSIDAGHVTFIDGTGHVRGGVPAGTFDRKRYEAALNTVREDPLTLLKRRMVRRIGHFRHGKGRQTYATKFYYDGSFCGEEIKELLKRRHSDPKQILLHAPISQWLRHAVAAFQIDRPMELIDLSLTPGKEAPWKSHIQERPLVLVPMVDSGRTIQQIHKTLIEANPRCNPSYLAIMSTEGHGDNGQRHIGVPPNIITIDYFIPVKQVRFSPEQEPSCAVKHAGSLFEFESEPPALTSYAWWSMISEARFKEEDDVPLASRKSLGFVPNFPEIMLANAPLLARKIERLLRESPGGIPVDPLLICPEETGAIEMANCIRSVIKCSVIRIPRSVIDKVPSCTTASEAIAQQLRHNAENEEWFVQLGSVARARSTGAVLIDEFAASGETLRRLSLLCMAAGINVERCVTLIDFQLYKLPHPIPIDSLYTLPLGARL